MALIDTQKWRSFCVGELFACDTTLNIPSKNDLTDGDINYITRSAVDNGLSGFCGNTESLNKGQCITIGAEGFVAFWQPDDFVAGNKVYTLRHKDLNEVRALFVCAALNVLSKDYSFANARVLDKIKKEVISLPATPDGQPDWAYMDAYMGEVLKKEEVFAEHLASLTAEAVVDGHLLDTSAWKAFHLYDIFDIDTGNKFDRGKMPAGDAVNFVGRTGSNNGINAVCDFVDGVPPYEAGALTLALGGTIGACFVQMDPFYTSQNVIVLFPKWSVSLAVKLFMAKIIWHVSDMYYDAFSNELNRHIKTDFVFYLPVTADGTPDWAWMEQYMQRQMDKAAALVEHLDAVWN